MQSPQPEAPTQTVQPDRARLQALLQEAGHIHRNAPERASELIEQILQSDAASNPDIYCNALVAQAELARIANPGCNNSVKLLAALRLAETHSLPRERIAILNALGISSYERNQPQLAYTHLSNALHLAQAQDLQMDIGIVQNSLGVLYARVGESEQAVQHFLGSLEAYKALDDSRGQGNAYSNIGALYLQVGEYELAVDYLKRSLPLRLTANDKIGACSTLINLAECAVRRHDLPAAIEHLQQAEFFAEQVGDFSVYPVAARLAYYFAQSGETQESRRRLAFLDKMEFKHSQSQVSNSMEGVFHRAAALTELGEYTQALQIIQQTLMPESGDVAPYSMENIHLLLARLHRREGAEHQALIHEQMADVQRARYRSLKIAREVHNMVVRTGLLRGESDVKTQNVQMPPPLLRNRIRNALATHTRVHNTLHSLRQKIQSDVANLAELPKAIATETLTEIRKAINSQDCRPLPPNYLERAQPAMIQDLKRRCAALTPAELRVCILIVMDFHSKEIARVLACATSTISSHRRNIRRKLELPIGSNLTDYLTALFS